jgi:hypothetical protein
MLKRGIALFALVLSLLMLMVLPGIAQTAPALSQSPVPAPSATPAIVATYTGTGTLQSQIQLRIVTTEGEKLLDGYIVVLDDHPTAYMVLKAGADAAGISLEIVDEATLDKMFINGIGDLKSENPKFWMYYINKETAQLGIGTQEVKDKDVLEFIYGDYSLGYVEVP